MVRQRTFGLNGRWIASGVSLPEGGQAHIHIVIDSTNERSGEYVVKLLKNAKRTARLDNEIQTTKRLYAIGCPVLEIVDDYLASDPSAERPWYIAPKIANGPLSRQLQEGKHFGGSIESALQIYRQIVEGVLSIHAQNVAHRDLKPDNILLQGNRIILADFGLALALGEFDGEKLTEELERIGSLHYTPPEAFSRRPSDQHQFAFDAFALGKVLYELLRGKPLPAFISPMDGEYDIAKKWDAPVYRGINRVLRGLLHNDPPVRMTYLKELPGQIDEFLESAKSDVRPAAMPRWHSDLLSASDLLAARVIATTAEKNPRADIPSDEAQELTREVCDVWQSSGAIKQLEDAFGVARGGHLTISPPTASTMIRSLLGGTQPTRKGLEPLEDRDYPLRPPVEAECYVTVSSANIAKVPFRQLWLCSVVGIKDDNVTVAYCVVRREEGTRASTDVVGDKMRLVSGHRGEPALIARVRGEADTSLNLFVQDVITEVRRAANQ